MKKNLDFKLNYYYHKYKDIALPNSDEFRKMFKKDNGNFELLNELVLMVHRYQVKKYGQTLPDPKKILRSDDYR